MRNVDGLQLIGAGFIVAAILSVIIDSTLNIGQANSIIVAAILVGAWLVVRIVRR